MKWSKLKNIVLFLLVVTNLCLLVIVGHQTLEEVRSRQQNRIDAIQFLIDRGVEITEEQVPDQIELRAQQVERDLELERQLAARLLGPAAQLEKRGGEVYLWSSGNGYIQFHSDGAFQAELAAGVFPVGEDREESCRKLLSGLDFQGELLEEEGDELTFRQLWQAAPLFTQQVTVEVRDGSVRALTAGCRLVGQPTEDPGRTTITVATALFQLFNGINALGDVCGSIDAITPGYVSAVSLSGPAALTPVWRVVTDIGAYQLDLVTGTLSRVSQVKTAAVEQ